MLAVDAWTLLFASIGVAALVLLACAVLLATGVRVARARGILPPLPTPASVAAPPPVPANLAELADLRGELGAVRAEWIAHRKQLDAYLDAFEDLEESVERRRRRAASSRSKAEAAVQQQAAEEPEPDPNSREAIRRRARARGFRV